MCATNATRGARMRQRPSRAMPSSRRTGWPSMRVASRRRHREDRWHEGPLPLPVRRFHEGAPLRAHLGREPRRAIRPRDGREGRQEAAQLGRQARELNSASSGSWVRAPPGPLVWHVVNHWRKLDPARRPKAIGNDKVDLRPLTDAAGYLIDTGDLFSGVGRGNCRWARPRRGQAADPFRKDTVDLSAIDLSQQGMD